MSDIDYDYEDPAAYDDAESFDGDGRLPPDWTARRHAVGVRQSGRCVACGRALDDGEHLVVEHVRSPTDGGDHRLENLVGRCPSCADRERHVSERWNAPTGGDTGGPEVDAAVSWLVFAAALLVALSPYLYDLYSHAGPRAPDGFLAYVPWLVVVYVPGLIGGVIDAAVALLIDLAQFVGAVILIVFGVLWLLGDL